MASSPKIIELRQVLAERFPQESLPPSTLFPTDLQIFDHLSVLIRGHLTEIVTPHLSTGGTLLLHEIIQSRQQASQFVALIDGLDTFDPVTENQRLLWIRCQRALDAIKATDLLLRDGNIELLILDLKQNSTAELRRIPATTWHRFHRVAEETMTALLVMTPYRTVLNSFAGIVLLQRLTIDDLSSFSTDILFPDQWKINRRKKSDDLIYAHA